MTEDRNIISAANDREPIISMTHDRDIVISTANSRQAAVWLPQSISWGEFARRIAQPVWGKETYEEYMALPKAEQDDLKDVGGFVGGTLAGERRRKGEVLTRDLITLDMDALPQGGVSAVTRLLDALGCAWAVYSTRKHEPNKPRIRVIVPLAEAIPADAYEPAARSLGQLLGLAWCDPTTFQPERLMYWPSVCRGAEYICETRDKPLLDGQVLLDVYTDWRDEKSWPRVPGTADEPRAADTAHQPHTSTGGKKADPRLKGGVVGAFCSAYTIPQAITAFLPRVYLPDPHDSSRYSYAKGSTAGGASVMDGGLFLFSHHASDPANGRALNAFDLVRLHRFGGEDQEAKPDTPVNRLPSYKKMTALAMGIAAVKQAVWQDRDEQNRERYSLPTPEEGVGEAGWMARLEVGSNGVINSPGNALTVLQYDPLMAGRFYKDSFSGVAWARLPLPWQHRSHEGEDVRLTDEDTSCMRIYMMSRTGNGVRTKDCIEDGVRACIACHQVNPVRDYLTAEPWDGVPRLDTLFIDYLGAADTPYTRKVARIMLVGAAARATSDRPVKFDTMCVLTGKQGIGKSTFIRKLAINDLYTDGLSDFNGKNAAEIVQGKQFVEVPELSALYRSDINRVKSFLSQEADDYRAAYGRMVENRPRRCVFFGTSNDFEYLSDPTGNRRFLPIDLSVTQPTKSIWEDLESEKQQIWAEAWLRLQEGEPLYLRGEVAIEAAKQQELHNTPDTKAGVIRDYIDRPVCASWHTMDLAARQGWLSSDLIRRAPGKEPVGQRDRICAQEVWQECLGGELRNMKNSDAREINRIIRATGEWEEAPNGISYGYCGTGRGFLRKYQ